MDLPNNSMILSESIDLDPYIFHGMEIYNHYGKSKSIQFQIDVHTISILHFPVKWILSKGVHY